jgi:anti-anti-sigma factor
VDEGHDEARVHDLRVHRSRSGVTLLQMSGMVDATTLPEFARLLDDALADQHPPRIVLDLAAVTSLGPGGVDALVAVEQRVREAGGTVEVLAPSAEVVLLLHDAAREDTERAG